MNVDDVPMFITLETTNTQGKESWAIWQRGATSHSYVYLVARVYDHESADRIVKLLNADYTNQQESK